MFSKEFFYNLTYPILSGVCGSLAGQAGKLAFQSQSLAHYLPFFASADTTQSTALSILLRVLALLAMLQLNQMMFKFLFNSFQVNGASQTTLISFLFNNAVNAVGGYLIFSETLSLRWCVSMLLILAGIMLLSKDGTQSANKQKLQ